MDLRFFKLLVDSHELDLGILVNVLPTIKMKRAMSNVIRQPCKYLLTGKGCWYDPKRPQGHYKYPNDDQKHFINLNFFKIKFFTEQDE